LTVLCHLEPVRPAYVAFLLFPRARSLRSLFSRYADCIAHDDRFAEPTCDRKPRTVNALTKVSSNESAKVKHLALISKLQAPDHTIAIYTDGFACPNPGRIGLGFHSRLKTRNRLCQSRLDLDQTSRWNCVASKELSVNQYNTQHFTTASSFSVTAH